MRKVLGLMAIMVLMAFGACMSEIESDLEKAIERDDAFLVSFLERNNINAIETPLGYYYRKDISNDTGNQIVNNDIVGLYYEIKTLDGQLIDSYLDESKAPRIFAHSEGGLVPRAMNFAAGLAKEGETFTLFVPSYLAYQEYSFQNLILPNSNLEIKVKFVATYSEEEIKDMEEQMILDYLEANNLTGFEKTEEGLFVKTISSGDEGQPLATDGNVVSFTYQLFQLGETQTLAQATDATNPFQISLGGASNLKFLNLSFKGLSRNSELEVISPSHLAFGTPTQVFPFQIRRDLFNKSYIVTSARPFEPVYFKTKVVNVRQ